MPVALPCPWTVHVQSPTGCCANKKLAFTANNQGALFQKGGKGQFQTQSFEYESFQPSLQDPLQPQWLLDPPVHDDDDDDV